jgi:hypothetical protein
MSKFKFAILWTFILLAAAYDTYFAWQHRAALESWELNPVAVWAASSIGLDALFAFKALGMLFATTVAWYCRVRYARLGQAMTAIIGGAYALLLVHYVIGYQQPTHAQRLEMRASVDFRHAP